MGRSRGSRSSSSSSSSASSYSSTSSGSSKHSGRSTRTTTSSVAVPDHSSLFRFIRWASGAPSGQIDIEREVVTDSYDDQPDRTSENWYFIRVHDDGPRRKGSSRGGGDAWRPASVKNNPPMHRQNQQHHHPQMNMPPPHPHPGQWAPTHPHPPPPHPGMHPHMPHPRPPSAIPTFVKLDGPIMDGPDIGTDDDPWGDGPPRPPPPPQNRRAA